MSYMEFSLSQMATSRDLVDSFDSICSHQNRSDKKLLVLMDEINCEIEGNSAMGLLLSPIWDGSFIRDGKYYRLAPAVWIFASTEPVARLVDHNKGPDFISRLNGPIIELDSLGSSHSLNTQNGPKNVSEALKNITGMIISGKPIREIHDSMEYRILPRIVPRNVRTEIVYLCVSELNRIWGPVSKIQEEVLWLFYRIVPINGIRSLGFFISKFQYIQRGVVTCSNVPLYSDFPEFGPPHHISSYLEDNAMLRICNTEEDSNRHRDYC